MIATKMIASRLLVSIFAALLVLSNSAPAFAINPEPYLLTALFDPGLGDRLYLGYVSGDGTPEFRMMNFNGSIWSAIPNDISEPQTAPFSPTMAVFQDELWVATIADPTFNPEPVLFRIYNGSAWTGPMPAPNYTIGAINPTITSFQYTGPLRTYHWLFLFWQTPENDIYGSAYEAIDGWLNEPFVIANETVHELEPAATVYGQLFVAWVSNDTILCKAFNGSTWSPVVNPGPVLFPSAPSLAVHNGLLYLAFEAEGKIYIQAFNDSVWTTGHQLIDPQPTPHGPAICSFFGSSLLYLAYVSQGQIYYQTYDGENWSTPIFIIPELNNALMLSIIIAASTFVILITKKIPKRHQKYVQAP